MTAPPLHLQIPDDATWEAVIAARLPLGLVRGEARREFFRDVFYDTPEGMLLRRGLECRVRHQTDGRSVLTVRWESDRGASGRRADLDITVDGFDQALRGGSGAAALLNAVVEPSRLQPVVEVQTDRHVGEAHWWRWPTPAARVTIDRASVVTASHEAVLRSVGITRLAGPGPSAARVGDALARRFGLGPALGSIIARARKQIDLNETSALTSSLRSPRECAVLLVRDGEVGLRRHDDHLGTFWVPGAGEDACREALDQAFGTSQAQVRYLGLVPARPWRRPIEVWMARHLPEQVLADPGVEWISLAKAIELAGSPVLKDTRALSVLHVASQSDVMKEHSHGVTSPGRFPVLPLPAHLDRDGGHLLDADLSQLDFNARVLELADERRLPVADRLNYLAIAAANLDEFVMVRIAALKRAVHTSDARPLEKGAAAASRLDAARLRAQSQHRAMHELLQRVLLPELGGRGLYVRGWSDLTPDQQTEASKRFHEEIRPRLVPLALTPNHPFPHVGGLEVALAVKLRHPDTGHVHFGTISLPSSLPRFMKVSDLPIWIPMESVVAAHLPVLFAGVDVLQAHVFRVTRSGEVEYDDADSTDALQHVADVVDRRPFQPAVRLEVDGAMPQDMRALLIQEYRFEQPDTVSDLEDADVTTLDGLPALRGLREVAAGISSRVPVAARLPFDAAASLFNTLASRDVLVHYPYDSFEASVLRFLRESSDDPGVEAITLTLYRTNAQSPVIEALHRARAAGKTVVALVELKARFDESRNIDTAKELRAAGVHVVYGVPGMKLHSKIILVLRREASGLRRYAFVGSGNLNPVTAALYTDVGLFTSDEAITSDLARLTESLTGLAAPPVSTAVLVSPNSMLPGLLARIQREIANARSGRPAGLRAKLNGLDDVELIQQLYDASRAGVPIHLSVRGICRLRPGLQGWSEHIQVISVLGEFLEHARIVEFTRGGAPEYFIGSADWRERNLRRRVEVMAPVTDAAAQDHLRRSLDLEWSAPGAWRLGVDGRWRRDLAGDLNQTSQRRQLAALAIPDRVPPVATPAASV